MKRISSKMKPMKTLTLLVYGLTLVLVGSIYAADNPAEVAIARETTGKQGSDAKY